MLDPGRPIREAEIAVGRGGGVRAKGFQNGRLAPPRAEGRAGKDPPNAKANATTPSVVWFPHLNRKGMDGGDGDSLVI
jgi:hypothetical protein